MGWLNVYGSFRQIGLRGEFQELRLDVRQKWEQSLEVHERLAAVEAKLEIR